MLEAVRDSDRIGVEGLIQATLEFADNGPSIEVVNLSASGAALKAEEPIGAVPERANLRMRAGDDQWVDCTCELRYILGENRPDGEPAWLHGVRFTEIPDPLRQFIERVLASAVTE